MPSIRRTKLAVVAAVLSGAAFLTACSSDDSDTKSAATSSADAAAPTAAPGSGQPAVTGGAAATTGSPVSDAPAPAKDATATNKTTSPKDGSETRSPAAENPGSGKGVNGTWFGNVKYLAPGKYTVSDMKGVEQAFFLGEDTQIWGAGEICGDAEGQSATECTEAQLEATTKGTGISATVVIKDGIATTITEDH